MGRLKNGEVADLFWQLSEKLTVKLVKKSVQGKNSIIFSQK